MLTYRHPIPTAAFRLFVHEDHSHPSLGRWAELCYIDSNGNLEPIHRVEPDEAQKSKLLLGEDKIVVGAKLGNV